MAASPSSFGVGTRLPLDLAVVGQSVAWPREAIISMGVTIERVLLGAGRRPRVAGRYDISPPLDNLINKEKTYSQDQARYRSAH